MSTALKTYFTKQTQAVPLAVFRVFFGVMMLLSIVRFWLNGWIDKLYIKPQRRAKNFFVTSDHYFFPQFYLYRANG